VTGGVPGAATVSRSALLAGPTTLGTLAFPNGQFFGRMPVKPVT
jgi:hypothetical protein